jgi:hypothetical protein
MAQRKRPGSKAGSDAKDRWFKEFHSPFPDKSRKKTAGLPGDGLAG